MAYSIDDFGLAMPLLKNPCKGRKLGFGPTNCHENPWKPRKMSTFVCGHFVSLLYPNAML